jgi:hypothetical protein
MIVKLRVVSPSGTVTLAEDGWATAGLVLESWTVKPPAGARPLRLTCPVALWPPVTLAGVSVSEAMAWARARMGMPSRRAVMATIRHRGSREDLARWAVMSFSLWKSIHGS